MGCFDSVAVNCPNCGNIVHFQSKADDCTLRVFFTDQVPLAIAEDLNETTECCPVCSTTVKLSIRPDMPKCVSMICTGQ